MFVSSIRKQLSKMISSWTAESLHIITDMETFVIDRTLSLLLDDLKKQYLFSTLSHIPKQEPYAVRYP